MVFFQWVDSSHHMAKVLELQLLQHYCLQLMQETWVRSLGWEGPLEKEMVTHLSVLTWRIPWTEEPGGLQCTASQRVGHNLATEQQRHQIGWENSKYFCKPILSTQDYFCRKIHQSSRSPGCWFFFLTNRYTGWNHIHRADLNCGIERSRREHSCRVTPCRARLEVCSLAVPPGCHISRSLPTNPLFQTVIEFLVVVVELLSCVRLFCDPMDCNLSGPYVHGFPRQEYWSGLPFPSPGHLLCLLHWQADSLLLKHQGSNNRITRGEMSTADICRNSETPRWETACYTSSSRIYSRQSFWASLTANVWLNYNFPSNDSLLK